MLSIDSVDLTLLEAQTRQMDRIFAKSSTVRRSRALVIAYLAEKVGEPSGSVGVQRFTDSSSGLPESTCMALSGRVKSCFQLFLGGVLGAALVQRGTKDQRREDKSLHPKSITIY